MTTIRNTLFAVGFMSLGALGAASFTAAAERGERGEQYERGEHGERGEGHRRGPEALFEGVTLTAAQQAQLQEMKSDMRAEREEHRAERGERAELMREMLEAKKVDRQVIYDRIDDKLAAQRELMVKRADFLMDFVETLDAGQKSQIIANLDAAQAEHEGEDEGDDDDRGR